MNRVLKGFLTLAAALLLTLVFASALADAKITYSPESPRLGDYVDITVTPEREGVQDVIYELTTPDGFSARSDQAEDKKKDKTFKDILHLTAAFRPRQETEYTLNVTLVYGKKDTETISVTIPVSGTAPVQEAPDVVYCQKDGWWADKVYSAKHHRSVQKSGCALFAMSHALQRMGITDEAVRPDKLAEAYSRFYINERGTDNEGLTRQAAEDYGFVTQADLIESEREIADCLGRGDLLSFMIVTGHIALADGISEDGTKVHVVDSATGATFERKDKWKTKGNVYYRAEDGSFVEADTPDQLPGNRWFLETAEYAGMAYWLDLSYCAHQGMRLIRLPWLTLNGEPVSAPEYAGALITKVTPAGGEAQRVNSRDLTWTTEGADTPCVALITARKGACLLDGNEKRLSKYSKMLPNGTMMIVLKADQDLCYVFWKDIFCYIARNDVDLLPVQQEAFETGLVSQNGRTAGTVKISIRNAAGAKSREITQWTIGTPVAVVARSGEYLQVEGKGRRGWIHQKNYTPDETAAPAETAGEANPQ